MSFYFSNFINPRQRKAECVFVPNNEYVEVHFLNDIDDIIELENKDFLATILEYAENYYFSEFEIVVNNYDFHQLDYICDTLYNYLFNNDVSVGLLFSNKDFYIVFKELIEKYGITYSLKDFLLPESELCKAKESVCKSPKIQTIKYDIAYRKPRLLSPKQRCGDINGLFVEKSFNEKLIGFLIESGKSNVEVYTKGGISRQVFSKIISTPNFIPRKDTIISLIIGMELCYSDAIELLNSAGYTLSRSLVFDSVIIKYLKKRIYDLDIINDELNERQCPLLGWKPRDN